MTVAYLEQRRIKGAPGVIACRHGLLGLQFSVSTCSLKNSVSNGSARLSDVEKSNQSPSAAGPLAFGFWILGLGWTSWGWVGLGQLLAGVAQVGLGWAGWPRLGWASRASSWACRAGWVGLARRGEARLLRARPLWAEVTRSLSPGGICLDGQVFGILGFQHPHTHFLWVNLSIVMRLFY